MPRWVILMQWLRHPVLRQDLIESIYPLHVDMLREKLRSIREYWRSTWENWKLMFPLTPRYLCSTASTCGMIYCVPTFSLHVFCCKVGKNCIMPKNNILHAECVRISIYRAPYYCYMLGLMSPRHSTIHHLTQSPTPSVDHTSIRVHSLSRDNAIKHSSNMNKGSQGLCEWLSDFSILTAVFNGSNS
jgi:hypothetical protein